MGSELFLVGCDGREKSELRLKPFRMLCGIDLFNNCGSFERS